MNEEHEAHLQRIKSCVRCGKTIYKRPKDTWKKWEGRQYCSPDCYRPSQVGRKHTPEALESYRLMGERNRGRELSDGARLKLSQNKKKFYSENDFPEEVKQKISKALTGRPSPLRGTGKRPLIKALRDSSKYALWRTAVFEKNDYACVLCGARSGNGKTVTLNADHHPVPLYRLVDRFLEENPDTPSVELYVRALATDWLWDVRNGRTLCVRCHLNTDSFGLPSAESRLRPTMGLEQELHLQRIKDQFLQFVDIKYSRGQAEHGGQLWLNPSLLDNAIDEAIDQVVYLLTLKEQQTLENQAEESYGQVNDEL